MDGVEREGKGRERKMKMEKRREMGMVLVASSMVEGERMIRDGD